MSFALSGDKGEPINGLWVSHKFMKKNSTMTKSTGRLSLGHDDGKSKFKLLFKEFTNNSVNFYVFPIDSSLERVDRENITNTNVGTLSLDHKKYSKIVVWKGKLVLNSGSHTGYLDVTGWSRTKKISRENIEKSREKQIDKLKKRIDESEAKVIKMKEGAREKIDNATNRGEEQIGKAEEKVERIRKKWWQFWIKEK